jgi:hypothetical protein
MAFLDELLASDETEERASSDVLVTYKGKLLTVRCFQIDGMKWSDITAQCPARPEAPLDRRYGYNWNSAALKAAPFAARLVEDDKEVPYAAPVWIDLFKKLAGSDVTAICSALWALNQWDPEQRVEAAKKASRGGLKKS